MKCGHPTCACQDDPRAAHGPYFTLTQKVGGKTRSRYIPPEQAPLVRQQIASGRQFRERVDLYWEACERWADEHLAAVPGSAEEAEKKGSRRTSKRQSPRKSRPLRPHGNGGASSGSDRDGRPTTALRLAAPALEQPLNPDRSDPVGAELPGACGGPGPYPGEIPGCSTARPCRPIQRGATMDSLPMEESTAHAISEVAPTRILHFDRRGRGGWKVVIGTRLKRAGMHGSVKGANAIIALRCNRLSGRFEDFWERRSDQKKVA
jgi:hypothetical protein